MTRAIPFTSSNYLQRFQTVEGESSRIVMLRVQKPETGARANNDYPHIGGH